jgi:hypothetical protein
MEARIGLAGAYDEHAWFLRCPLGKNNSLGNALQSASFALLFRLFVLAVEI